MHNILQRLDRQLSTKRPEYYALLNAPLNDAAIDQLEEKYQVKVPENLRTLYRWKNGQGDDCYEALVNNSMFIPLEEALDTAAGNTGMIGSDFEVENWWNENWIPVFHNGGGDYVCYDKGGIFTGNEGQIIEFWHADTDRNVIAPNLETFLESLNHYLETTEPDDFDEFFSIDKNLEQYTQRFRVD